MRDGGGSGADAGTSQPTTSDAGTSTAPAEPPSGLADCGEWPPVEPTYPVLAACLGFDSGEPPPGAGQVTITPPGMTSKRLEFRGRVIATGTNLPPMRSYCFDYPLTAEGSIFLGTKQVRAYWVHIEDESGARAVVGVLGPGFAWRLLVGDSITVEEHSESGGFGISPSSKLEIRKESGELVAWFGLEPTVDKLQTPPEVALTLGKQQCRGVSSCFPIWSRFELNVQLQGDDAPSPLGYGRRMTFGDFVVVHGGLDVSLETGRCGESQLNRVAAGIWLTPF